MGGRSKKGGDVTLTEQRIKEIMDATEQATATFNERMCERVAERIVKLYESSGEVILIPSSRGDIRKILQTGRMGWNDIVEEVARLTPDISEEVRKAFVEAGAEIADDVNRTTRRIISEEIELSDEAEEAERTLPKLTEQEKRGIPKSMKDLPLTEPELRKLESAYNRTNGTIHNLTRTTASEWQNKFIEVCDRAFWEVDHGVSREDAIARAIDEAAQYGSHVVYPSGHKDTVEVAVARAVRTGIAQAAGDVTLTRCAEAGWDHVLVSSHADARVTDKVEPANHASWQGKVYHVDWGSDALKKYNVTPKEEKKPGKIAQFFQKIRSFFIKKKPAEEYPDFVTVTGYGTGPGLCGWNCRHSFTPFIPGVSQNNTEQYDLEEVEKNYRKTQQQRAKERAIRKTRRRLSAAEEALKDTKDPTLQAKLEKEIKRLKGLHHNQHKSYMDFCKENGLKAAADRFYIPRVRNDNPLQASDRSDKIASKNVLHQDNRQTQIPKEYLHNYEECNPLEITEEEKTVLDGLRSLADQTGYEYGRAIVDSIPEEPFTNELPDKVHVPEKYLGSEKTVLLYHSHTLDTTLSSSDLKLLVHENVDKVVVITRNNDIFSVEVGDGYRPLDDEFDEIENEIYKMAMENISDNPSFNAWTPEEKWYAFLREKAFILANRFGWTLRGGSYYDL